MMIQLDKLAHFLGGYAVSLTVALISTPLTGFIVSCLFWAGKEVVDAMGHGTPDKYDFLASAVGALVALLVPVAACPALKCGGIG